MINQVRYFPPPLEGEIIYEGNRIISDRKPINEWAIAAIPLVAELGVWVSWLSRVGLVRGLISGLITAAGETGILRILAAAAYRVVLTISSWVIRRKIIINLLKALFSPIKTLSMAIAVGAKILGKELLNIKGVKRIITEKGSKYTQIAVHIESLSNSADVVDEEILKLIKYFDDLDIGKVILNMKKINSPFKILYDKVTKFVEKIAGGWDKSEASYNIEDEDRIRNEYIELKDFLLRTNPELFKNTQWSEGGESLWDSILKQSKKLSNEVPIVIVEPSAEDDNRGYEGEHIWVNNNTGADIVTTADLSRFNNKSNIIIVPSFDIIHQVKNATIIAHEDASHIKQELTDLFEGSGSEEIEDIKKTSEEGKLLRQQAQRENPPSRPSP